MKKLLPVLLSTFMIMGVANAQTYTPIALSGYNYDGIAEDTLAVNTTTGGLDNSGYVLYTANYATKVGTAYGLPNSGAFSSGTKSYQLQPYNINNILRINAGLTDSLTLTTPASYASLSLLGFATEGNDQLDVTLRFTNGDSTIYYTLALPDWFFNPGPSVVLNNIDRTLRSTDTPSNTAGDPSLYSVTVDLSCADQKKQIKSIVIQNIGGGGQYANIFGVSGSDTTVTINYPGTQPYTPPGTVTPAITGINTGTFSSTAGLYLDTATGVVNLDSSYNGSYTVTYNYTNGGCTSFTTAPVAITGALPVKLIYFKAVKQGSSALVQWATTEEINNNYFEVQRSGDGINFTTLNKVTAGNNNSSQIKKYSVLDSKPLPNNNYYRLKQVDIDGNFTYSSVTELSFSQSSILKVYPNPTSQNEISVQYSLGLLKSVAIYNSASKLMMIRSVNNQSGYQQLDVSTLPKGVYIIKLTGENGNESVMFTKQ